MNNIENPYKRNKEICDCDLCAKGNYNSSDFSLQKSQFENLNMTRPNGISGHLRAWEEEMSVAECIESCLPFLDELIITYNKSNDKTEKILKQYQKKYPDKIRLFFYKPYIVSSSWISFAKKDDELDTTDFRKTTSIHNPANYYNFGLVKIKYKYYMKIDADQIYFTEKFLNIRDNLMNFNEYQNKYLIIINWLLIKLTNFFMIPSKNYFLSSFLNVYKENFIIILGGVNVCALKNSDNIYIPKEAKLNSCVGDHFILKPTEDNFYFQKPNEKYEILNYNLPKCHAGLGWLHVQLFKPNITDEMINEMKLIEWKKFKNKKIQFFKPKKISRTYLYYFFCLNYYLIKNWSVDRKFLNEKSIIVLKKIKLWANKNKYK